MRWFVEISSLGSKTDASTLCVDAPQWQPALQKARALQGQEGSLSNFSIELLEEGFRAVDPATRLRYLVKRAPDDAAISTAESLKAGVKAEKPKASAPKVTAPAAQEPSAKKRAADGGGRAPVQTVAFGSPGAAIAAEGRLKPLAVPTAPTLGRAPSTLGGAPEHPAAKAKAAELPSFILLNQREENPTEGSPLHYREYVYVVAPGTSDADAKGLLLDRFEQVRLGLEKAPDGKLINLAIFDHSFQGKPLRRPLATLTWKDWKADEPEVLFPFSQQVSAVPPTRNLAAQATPAPAAPVTPAPVAPVVVPAAPVVVRAAPVAPAAPVAAPAAPVAAPAAPVAAPVVVPAAPVVVPSAPVVVRAAPAAPVAAPAAPVAAPAAPVAAPVVVPVAAPAAPVVVPAAPVTPVAAPAAPVVVPAAPVTPVVVPAAPVVVPAAPIVVPAAPIVVPAAPIVVPVTPVVVLAAPAAPVVAPVAPVVVPVVAPAAPVIQEPAAPAVAAPVAPSPAGPTLASAEPTTAPIVAVPVVVITEPAKPASAPPAAAPVAAPAPAPAPVAPAATLPPDTPGVPPTAPVATKPAAMLEPVPERKSAPAPAASAPVAVVSKPAPAKSAAPPASKPVAASPTQPSAPAKPKKRLSGEDLLSELFEAFGDLHFLSDSLEGAEFVLDLTLEKLPSEAGMISLFDINKREFVVVRHTGGTGSALLQRQPEKAPIASLAMRTHNAVIVSDSAGAARATDDRWRGLGVELKSLVCAPVELSGRYLGLIELANPLDGSTFTEGDGNALSYIGQQFGEFVAQRGVILDPEQIKQAAQPRKPLPTAPAKRR